MPPPGGKLTVELRIVHRRSAADRFCMVLRSSVLLSSASKRHIGVRVLPASAVLISNGDACAFLARQEKPKTQPASPAAVSYTA